MAAGRTRVEFPGSESLKIAGLLESPPQNPIGFVLFAHCFTCGKDLASASRIARALVARGYAVLRFDFTGLGSSDGDFANSNFSSNVADLVHAADFLRANYRAPALLIGHSLGGAAVLAAAEQVPEAQGVVAIAAPSDPAHVVKNFGCDLMQIEKEGLAEVSLAGRPFTIKKQFIDDLAAQDSQQKIGNLKKALLLFHSPLDETVAISEAEKIYRQAKHPKSFVSLDKADHLLSRAEDADYVGSTIAAWASRYISDPAVVERRVSEVSKGHIRVEEKNKQFTRTIISDSHIWLSDEPTPVGGSDLGPDPYEHLLAALGSCTSMTVRMYANLKQIPLEDISVELRHDRIHQQDCEDCDAEPRKLEVLYRYVTLKGDLTKQQRQRLLEIADRCPVHRTLHAELEVRTELADG